MSYMPCGTSSGPPVAMIVDALKDSIELLREENLRLRSNNKVLRIANGVLRRKCEELMNHADDVFLQLVNEQV